VNIAVNIVDQRANLYRCRFARAGYISKNFHSHVSIVKFSLKNSALPPLGTLDSDLKGKSDNMSDCFHLAQKPLRPSALP